MIDQLIANWNAIMNFHSVVQPEPLFAWAWMIPAALGLASGVMKNQAAQRQESSDRKLASETQRYSPWTGQQAQPIRSAGSMFGDALQGGTAGFSLGQNITAANGANALQGAQTGYWQEMLKQKQREGIVPASTLYDNPMS